MRSNRPKVMAQIAATMQARHSAGGVIVQNAAKERCPVDSGRLRASITHKARPDGVIVGTDVEYAPYVELGTYKMAAQPYLEPGLMQSVSKLRGVYGGLF